MVAIGQFPANLFHRSARPHAGLADQEDNAVDALERMSDHQRLHCRIGGTAPMAAGEKGPADLDFAGLGAVKIIARGADDGATARIKGDQRAATCQRFVEEAPEHRFLPAIMRRMPGPDLRVGGCSEQRRPVRRRERPQLDTGIGEMRLAIERVHATGFARSVPGGNQFSVALASRIRCRALSRSHDPGFWLGGKSFSDWRNCIATAWASLTRKFLACIQSL